MCSLILLEVDCIEGNELVENDDMCMRILSEAKNFHLLPERRDKIQFLSEPRKMDHEAMMYVIGGEIHSYVFSTVERFSFETQTWEKVAPMHKQRDGVGVTTYSGLIYAAGGKCWQNKILHAVALKLGYNA